MVLCHLRTILFSKIKKFSGEGTQLPPQTLSHWGGHAISKPHSLVAFGTSTLAPLVLGPRSSCSIIRSLGLNSVEVSFAQPRILKLERPKAAECSAAGELLLQAGM